MRRSPTYLPERLSSPCTPHKTLASCSGFRSVGVRRLAARTTSVEIGDRLTQTSQAAGLGVHQTDQAHERFYAAAH
jgi:hypothetical protein